MRAYFPSLIDRLERERHTQAGIRRWLVAFRLEGLRWCLRLIWSNFIVGASVLPIVAYLDTQRWETSPLEWTLSLGVAVVLTGLTWFIAVYGILATKSAAEQQSRGKGE